MNRNAVIHASDLTKFYGEPLTISALRSRRGKYLDSLVRIVPGRLRLSGYSRDFPNPLLARLVFLVSTSTQK